MRSIKSLFISSLVIIQLSGCASVFEGVEQTMHFKSEPAGAAVFVDGLKVGQTPLTVNLRKEEYKHVRLKKAGYRDHVIVLQTKFDKISLINLIFPEGFAIDLLSGAMFAYAPDSYSINLTRLDAKKLQVR